MILDILPRRSEPHSVRVQSSNCNDTAGDEYHYLIKYHVFNHERSQYLHKYIYKRPNMYNNIELLQPKHFPTVRQLSVFCYLTMKKI